MADLLAISSKDLEHGVYVQASKNGGAVSLLIANHKYRIDRATDIEITLPPSVASGRVVSHHVIDRTRSSPYDVGSGAGELETTTGEASISGGVLSLTMQPRSVHLITVAKKRRRKMFSCFAASKTDHNWRR